MKQTAIKRHKSKPNHPIFPYRTESVRETKSFRKERIKWRKWQNRIDRFKPQLITLFPEIYDDVFLNNLLLKK